MAPSSSGATSRTGPSSSARRSVEGGTDALRTGDELGQLLADPLGCGAAATVAGADRALDAEHVADLRGEVRRHLGQLRIGELGEVAAELLAAAYRGAGHLVRLTERHALAN